MRRLVASLLPDLGVCRAVAQLVWPARCAACDALVPDGVAFCEPCIPSVLPLGTACPRCAMPVTAGPSCPTCAAGQFGFTAARSVLMYGGAVTQALLRWKHGRIRALGPVLAPLLAPALGRALAGMQGRAPVIVLPVPLHPSRLRHRGFNQALDLARVSVSLVNKLEPPGCGPQPQVMCDALARVRDTMSLGHGSPAERRAAVAGAFVVRRARLIKGRPLLLVDDVLTTGATAAEATRTLLAAGADGVSVLTLARAV